MARRKHFRKFEEILREHTEIYLDDILIHTKDESTHNTVLERV